MTLLFLFVSVRFPQQCPIIPTSLQTALVVSQTYLLWGYVQLATEGYDVDWTTPHCVLTLRLIGLAFDVMDGADKGKQGKDALTRVPGLLDMLGFCFCFCGATVGPQYSFRLYSSFVVGSLVHSTSGRVQAGVMRLVLGLFYVGVVAFAMGIFPDSRLFEPSFYTVSGLYNPPYR